MGHLCLTKQKQCWPCSHFRVTQQKMGRNRFELFQIRFGQNSCTKPEKLGMQIAYRRLGLSCFVTHVRSIAVKGKLSKEMWYDKNERVIS